MSECHISAGLLCGATIVLSALASDAGAAARRQHSLDCTPSTNLITHDANGQGYNATGISITLYCPAHSDVGLATGSVSTKNSQVTLETNGYSNSAGGVTAKACYTFKNGGGQGGVCGTTASGGAAQVVHLAVDTSAWKSAGADDYPYVAVTLAPQVNGSVNVLFGNTISVP